MDAGVSLDQVASLAGYSNLQTTARYTKATEHDLQIAVDRLAWEYLQLTQNQAISDCVGSSPAFGTIEI